MVLTDVPLSTNFAFCARRPDGHWGAFTRPGWHDENRARGLPYHSIGNAAEQCALHAVMIVCADDDEVCIVVSCVAYDLVRWAPDHDARER